MLITDQYIWLSAYDLDKFGQISRKTIGAFNLDKVKRRKHEGTFHYRIDTLSVQSRSKLPKDDYLKSLQTLEKHQSKTVQIITYLEEQWEKNRLELINKYRGLGTEIKVTGYAKSESLHSSILKLLKRKFSLKDIHASLQMIPDLPFKCTHYNRFTPRIKDFRKAIESSMVKEFIIDKRGGRQPKFSEIHQAIVLEIHKNAQKLDKRRTWIEYKEVCERHNYIPVGLTTIKNFLNQDDIKAITAQSRHGSKYYDNDDKYRPHTKRSRPNYSFSCAAGDGWYPGHAVIKPNGSTGRVVVWLWYDWKTETILGYEIGLTETAHLVRNAFKNILKLHNGQCPKSIVTDKMLAKNKDNAELFSHLGVIPLEKRAYNPKSNPAERLNKELNKIHHQLDPYWANITNNSIEYKHNDEHLKQAQPLSMDKFKILVDRIVNAFNHEKLTKYNGLSRIEYLEANKDMEPIVIDPTDQVLAFGTHKLTTVRNGFIYFNIGSKKYTYEVPNWHKIITKINPGLKVRIYFDEEDLESISVFNYSNVSDTSEDVFLCQCKQVTKFNPLPQEQINEDKQALEHSLGRIKKFDSWRDSELAKYDAILNDNDLTESIQKVGQSRYKELQNAPFAKLYSNHYLQDVHEPPHQDGSKSKLKSNSNELKAINPDV